MRLQGRVTEWNDERGFGFVTQNGTDLRAFLHISELSDGRRRPSVGGLITYEVAKDNAGRMQVRRAKFVGEERTASSGATGALGSMVVGLLVLLVAGYVGYVRFSNPNSTVSASIYKVVSAKDAITPHPEFQCRPEKNSCSKMTSCAEALFHQERCAVQDMDGDRDGIPCEQQWCN